MLLSNHKSTDFSSSLRRSQFDGPLWDNYRKEYRFDLGGSRNYYYSSSNKTLDSKKYSSDGEIIGLKKRCSKCSVNLAYAYDSYERNGIVYCEGCYHKNFSLKCQDCKEPIKDPSQAYKIQGKSYHYDHVRCSECKIRIYDTYRLKDGKLYCENDYHRLFSPQCGLCIKPIRQNGVFTMGKNYHDTCFRCVYCYKKLDEKSFVDVNGQAYCRSDWFRIFSSKCRACQGSLAETIYGKSIYALGYYFHPKCFKCTDCSKQLNERFYREFSGKPYCKNCHHVKSCKECSHKIDGHGGISSSIKSLSIGRGRRSASPRMTSDDSKYVNFWYRPKSSLY